MCTTEVGSVMIGKTYEQEPPYIKGSGHVVKSLEAALWAFNKSTSFKHGVLLAVNLGEDADTTAAIYGQLAGAYYGYSAIPKIWKDTLIKRNLIEKYALGLYKLANGKTTKTKKGTKTKKATKSIS
jgi:ADP-ribosyl-[dinitrogen reductase] hydrolase